MSSWRRCTVGSSVTSRTVAEPMLLSHRRQRSEDAEALESIDQRGHGGRQWEGPRLLGGEPADVVGVVAGRQFAAGRAAEEVDEDVVPGRSGPGPDALPRPDHLTQLHIEAGLFPDFPF